MQSWERDYSAWKSYERNLNNPTPPLPNSSSTEIIEGFSSGENGDSIRGNSKAWSRLVDDWSSIHVAYNETYGDTCSQS